MPLFFLQAVSAKQQGYCAAYPEAVQKVCHGRDYGRCGSHFHRVPNFPLESLA
jgi:hypothetical protein